MKAYSKKYRQCSLHDVKCLRDNRRKFNMVKVWYLRFIIYLQLFCRRIFKFEATGWYCRSQWKQYWNGMCLSANLFRTSEIFYIFCWIFFFEIQFDCFCVFEFSVMKSQQYCRVVIRKINWIQALLGKKGEKCLLFLFNNCFNS